MKNTLLLIILTLGSLVTFAQKVITDSELETKLFKPYVSVFEKDREWVYTHLNKSEYIQGDDIWFTSYVINPANKLLNFTTSKLYVELWSPEKKLINRKILYVAAGTANYYLHLSDSLAPGSYCFRTYTSWMLNFYPENDLNTTITILGRDKVSETGPKVKKNIKPSALTAQKEKIPEPGKIPDYDIQFLPESGTFLEGVDNILGIRATDPNGRGMAITGKVFTADNQEIVSFSTNESGADKITIPEVTNQQYNVKIVLPDSTIRDMQLPKAQPKGVIIQINPYSTDMVWFRTMTNEATRQLNKSYLVMIHANGVIFNNYRINFSRTNAVQFKLKKKEMARGIVFATIFDENLTPVAERIFYNQDTLSKGKLTLNAQPLTNDTVNLEVHLTDSLTTQGFAKLSISVLPGETLLNHFTNSLRSESILRPALRGPIENPDSYFEKTDINHTVAIDNLLLTQGWRKYDWPVLLKDTLPKFTHLFEEAFSIEGRVKNWLKNKPDQNSNITLISPLNNLFLLTPVDSVGTFKFDRVYLNDSTWIIASASSAKGKNWNRVLQMTIPESFTEAPDFQQTPEPAVKQNKIPDDIPQLTKGDILLQEVVITAEKKKPFADNMNIGIMSRTMELTKENFNQFSTMERLLMIQFNVMTEQKQDGGYHFNMGRSSTSDQEPLMMIDGMKVFDPQDILFFPLTLVEGVAVNKDGLGGGMDGSAGTIAIKTRTTPLFVNDAEATNIKRILVKGYAPPVKYFEPKYIIRPGSIDYDRYATIFWKPELIIDQSNKANFKFSVPQEIKTITLRVEGISSDGRTFNHDQKITLPGRD